MGLTYGLKTPKDLLAKLNREHVRLEREVTSDDFFNFVVTAYHIIDWIKNDPSVPAEAKVEISSLYANTHIAVCRDIANASKHFALKKDYKGRVTEKVSAISDYGTGRYGKGQFGVGEESIVVVLTDGQRFDTLALSQKVVAIWTEFFAKHHL
jgi:hypothetical protein